jgi:carboxypeptidase family protein
MTMRNRLIIPRAGSCAIALLLGCGVARAHVADAGQKGSVGRIVGVATTQSPGAGAAPLVNVTLSPGGRTTATDTAGQFVFDSVPAGRYGLQFKSAWYLPYTTEVEVKGAETATVHAGLDLDMKMQEIMRRGLPTQPATKP